MLQRYHDVKQIEAAEESASDSLLYGSSPCNGQVRLTFKGLFILNTCGNLTAMSTKPIHFLPRSPP